jgi:hypothetical protein
MTSIRIFAWLHGTGIGSRASKFATTDRKVMTCAAGAGAGQSERATGQIGPIR